MAVLDVEATNLGESAGGRIVAGEELGDNGEFGAGVDSHALAVEGGITHAERIEVATVGVAETVVAAVDGTVLAFAASLAIDLARVRSVGGGHGVGFPDVHFTAAGTVIAGSCVDVIVGWLPAFDVGLISLRD